MGVAAYSAIVATIALLVGGVAGGILVPMVTARRQQALAEAQGVQARNETLAPAYDPILQAIGRLEAVADSAESGYRVQIPETWEADCLAVAEAGKGAWPLTNPSDKISLRCMALHSYAKSLSYAVERSRFTKDNFEEAFSYALKEYGDPERVHRMIDEEMTLRIQTPRHGSDVKKVATELSALIIARRDREIGA